MKNIFIILCLVLITGCATPSEIYRTYENEKLVSESIKYDNSTFYSARIYGIDLGFDIDTKIPRIRAGIIKYESARTSKGQRYYSDFGFEDVSLIKGEGTGHQKFVIEDE